MYKIGVTQKTSRCRNNSRLREVSLSLIFRSGKLKSSLIEQFSTQGLNYKNV
ncbi:hypothetical protein DSOL_2056 [Desulfosporosinus metallidurans]|uniref:Uncharacterized protein n=1 Tax=Desulfosporosinus metallidurans TaxID=1888891 RepID=A0A1Q8QX99_9FIRM|nr:hypothetical protein DSOL_2056 [Desulfosporosinus metallidurans]